MDKRFWGLRNSVLLIGLYTTPYFMFETFFGSFTPSLYGFILSALALIIIVSMLANEIRDKSSSYSGNIRESGKAKITIHYILMSFAYSFLCLNGTTYFAHKLIAEEELQPSIAFNSKATGRLSIFVPFGLDWSIQKRETGVKAFVAALKIHW